MQCIGFYIHIPFCVSKCIYCNFNSMPSNDYNAYVDALCLEIALRSRKHTRQQIKTLYFGGGTPTLLSIAQFEKILNALNTHFDLSQLQEFTLECNPSSATRDKIEAFARFGVNRFSVGLQCANDDVLKILHRPHTVADFEATVDIIHDCGIKNVGCDIILGLPNASLQDVDRAVELVVKHDITHLSAYTLALEKGTELYRKAKEGVLTVPNDQIQAEQYEYVFTALTSNRFHRYEVSNYAIDGYECKHNLGYWQYTPYLACGVSGAGFFDHKRYRNVANIDNYISKVSQGRLPISAIQTVKDKEQREEYIMLSLRTSEGLNLCDYRTRFGDTFDVEFGASAQFLLDKHALVRVGDSLIATDPLLLNSLLVRLLYGV